MGGTSVGTYATLPGVRTRMTQANVAFGTGDDAILQTICDQVNGWIEAITGRIFMPYAVIATTIASGGAAGSSAVTLASAAGVAIGDAIAFGPVTGAHEHQIVAGVNLQTNVITLQSPLVATYANGTAVARVTMFDVEETYERGRMIQVANGIVYATALEVAYFTGGAFNLIPTTDWYLRPTPLEREPGWPATELWTTDIPSSGNPAPVFNRGLATVRLWGQPGWPATPSEIIAVAERLVVSMYRGRSSSGGGMVMVGADGSRQIEMAMTVQDWKIINTYESKDLVMII